MTKAARYLSALALLVLAACVAGCGASAPANPPGDTLTVYLSVPRHGVAARTAADVTAGARLALADAHGHVEGRRIRLLELDNSKQGEETWDPSVVEANAKRAAADPDAIAYIGELDTGASAISVPVTNDAGIFQVSPLDGLTSLTRDEPGTPLTNGPARYYPSGTRSFQRLVPTDYDQAAALVAWARDRGARRIALLQDERLSGRELSTQAHYVAARMGIEVVDVEEAHDDPADYPKLARRVALKSPDALIYTGLGDRDAGQLLAAARRAMPGIPLLGGSDLATSSPAPAGLPPTSVVKPALPTGEYGPRARRVIDAIDRASRVRAGPEALYGYEAMRVVLDAIRAAGRGAGRAAVIHAAMAAGARNSVIGRYGVDGRGDVSTTRFGGYRLAAGRLVSTGVREPPAASLKLP
jgi:branched-chain amino acid transport system substrate-binding protein